MQALQVVPSVTAGYWGAGQPGNQRSDNFAAYKALVDSGISLIDTAEASKRQHEVDGMWCCPDCGLMACWTLQRSTACGVVRQCGTGAMLQQPSNVWNMTSLKLLTPATSLGVLRLLPAHLSCVCRSKAFIPVVGTCLYFKQNTVAAAGV